MAANINANNRCRHYWDGIKEQRREAKRLKRITNLKSKRRKLLKDLKS